MKTYSGQERYKDHKTAELNFKNTIDALGLNYETQKISPFTSICHVKNRQGTVERGNGKGIGPQSDLSAQFEALEHYFSIVHSRTHLQCSLYSYAEIKEICRNIPLSSPFCDNLLNSATNSKMPWVKCDHLYKEEESWMPYISINPLYTSNESDAFTKFCSNNGTAIGSNEKEAIIHGLSELIERDALSIFLYSSYIAGISKAKRILKSSLPDYLSQIVNIIENQLDEDLVILDITSDLGIPVFLVSFSHQKFPIQPIGTGCSLHQTYALERAILEAIQMYDLSVPEEREKDKKILENFRSWPAFYQCAKLELKNLIAKIPMVPLEEHSQEDSPDQIYSKIIERLKNNYIDIYKSLIYNDANVSCVKLISPQLEQFHLCRSGHFTLPGERIRRIFKNGDKS